MATTKTAPKKKAVTKKAASSVKAPRAARAPKAQAENALEASLFDVKGASAGTLTLPPNIFGLPWNADLVHQVVISMQANARGPIAHTKDRSEVRGGGRKPWKQKGTGRARHGSSRSPIWVGGGVAHGPRNEKSYAKKINRNMRRKALLVALSRKYRDGEVVFVSDFGLTTPKASKAKEILTSLSKIKGYEHAFVKKSNAALIATVARDASIIKSFGNFGNITVTEVGNLNPVSILSAKYLVLADAKAAVEALSKRINS